MARCLFKGLGNSVDIKFHNKYVWFSYELICVWHMSKSNIIIKHSIIKYKQKLYNKTVPFMWGMR